VPTERHLQNYPYHTGLTMRQVALYVGPSGQQSTYPVRAGHEPPASITSASGEVRTLKMIHHVPEVSEQDRATAHAMAVTS